VTQAVSSTKSPSPQIIYGVTAAEPQRGPRRRRERSEPRYVGLRVCLSTQTGSIAARRRMAPPQRGVRVDPRPYVLRGSPRKPILVIGIVLLVVGIAMVAYQGISYTRREQVAQLGPLRVTLEEHTTLPLSPVAGAAAVTLYPSPAQESWPIRPARDGPPAGRSDAADPPVRNLDGLHGCV